MATRPIDEKIVAMKMDNSDFKNKALETTSIFGKMTDALNKIPGVNMSKVTQSFGDIRSAASRVDLSTLSSNIESIAGRFSNLGVVATTALATIANRATNAGLALAKSLTIQPLADGFREYETKMSSIGTMLSNTEWAGSTLKDVKKTLGELNDYADNTIYSFEQMTSNVGRFTAAGVKLEDSAIAIKGLGNLAASSGSNVDQLNTVMYQMSQALAAGKLNLMDWNSLVNGGMAGKKTQDALLATAKAMGKNVDLTDGFRASIEQGWLTSEVLLETLKKFGADESMTKAATSVRTFTGFLGALKESIGSGWATTWELIFGDFDEATRRWTGISEAVGGFFKMFDNGRNSLVKSIADAGVFQGMFDIVINSGKAVLSIFQAVGKGIKKAFAGTNLGLVDGLGKGLKKFAESIKPSEKTLNNITIIFQAIFSVVNLVVRAFGVLGKILFAVVSVPLKLVIWLLDGLVTGILNVSSFIGKLVIAFTDGVKSGENLYSSLGGLQGIFSAVGSVIGTVINKVSSFVSAIKEVWKILVTGDVTKNGPWAEDSNIVNKIIRIRDAVIYFGDIVEEFWKILATGDVSKNGPWAEDSKMVTKLLTIREAVIDFVREMEQAYKILSTGEYVKGPLKESDKLVGRLLKVREAVVDFITGIQEAWSILAKGDFTGKGPWEEDDKIVKSLFKIRDAAMDFATGIQEAWSILMKGDFTGKGPWEKDSKIVDSLFKVREAVKSFVDWLGSTSSDLSIEPIVAGFEKFIDLMKNGPWNSDTLASWLSKIGDGIKKVTSYLGDLNFSLDPIVNGFKNFFGAVHKGFDWIVEKASAAGKAIKNFFGNIEGSDVVAGGFITGLIAVVGMALKMAWDLFQVFTGWGKIGQGVSDTLDAVAGALNAFSAQVYSNAIMTIAIALGVLAAALWVISTIPVKKVAAGLYGLIGVMTAMVGAMAIMNKYEIQGTGMGTALQMVAMAGAVLIIATALKKLGGLKPEEISKGLYGLLGVMATLALTVSLMSKYGGGGQVGATALQFVALAAAVHILAGVVEELAKIKPEALTKGVVGLGWILVELGVFSKLYGKSTFGMSAGLGMLGMAKSILMIADAIKEISKIEPDNLKTGLNTIAKILVAIGLFSVVTSNMGLATTGAGMLLLAVALNALIIPIAIMGNMDLNVLAQGLGAMAIALLAIGAASRLMTGMVAAGVGVMLIAVALGLLIPPIITLGSMQWQTLATGIIAVAGAILLIGGAAALLGLASGPLMLGAAGIALLGIAMLAAGAGMSLFATGLVSLAAMTGAAITTIVATLGTLIVGLASLIPTAVDFVVKIIMQMATAVMANAPLLFDKFTVMIIEILNVIAKHTPDFIDAAVKIITNFLDGLARNLPKIVESATNLMVTFVESLATAVEENGPRFIDAVMSLMAEVTILMVEAGIAVVQALFGWIPGVTEATNEIGATAEKTIREAFDAEGAGKDKGKDFAKGIDDKKGDAKKSGENVSKSAKDGANSSDLGAIGSGKGSDFANALANKVSAATTSGTSLAEGGKGGAASVSMTSTGSNFGLGFAGGISSAYESVVSAAKSLAKGAKAKVQAWLDIHSPSREMFKDGGHFGEGFALGIIDKVRRVEDGAKSLAVTAKETINSFLDDFELPEDDNELHFKAVVDYDSLDVDKFGRITPLTVKPDTSLTNGLITATKADLRQNGDKNPTGNIDQSVTTENNYEIKVEVKGISSRAEIRKLAEQVQTEIKNANDRARISRGEEVAF